MVKLFKPELSSGQKLGVLVKAENKFSAINQAQEWLQKSLNENERKYFTDTDTPYVSDALEVKEEAYGVLVV